MIQRDMRRAGNHLIHGDDRAGRRSKLYSIWAGMLRRCNNPNEESYPRYGGRGIAVCDRWMDYQNFKADMASSYVDGRSIERVDNDGNYEPSNCRWATRKEQARNRSSSLMVQYKGQTLALAKWAEVLGLSYTMLVQRISVLGWEPERAFEQPARGWAPHRRRNINAEARTEKTNP